MAKATRRKRKPAPAAAKPTIARRTKTPPATNSVPEAALEERALPVVVFEEADPVVADAADRAADLRDLAADDAARILADGETRAGQLLDAAHTEAATITKAATTEQARLLADAQAAADRLREQAAKTAVTDAEQVLADAKSTADQLLAEARQEADTVTSTAAGNADKVLADAKSSAEELLADAQAAAEEVRTDAAATAAADADQVLADAKTAAGQLLADARRRSEEVAATAVADAETARAAAAQAAAQALADGESARAELLAAAERAAAQARSRAAAEADEVLERARSEADRLRAGAQVQAERVRAAAEKTAAELREDAGREREAARADAERVRKLAEEDIDRLRATANEDVERLTSTARQDAERLLVDARTQRDVERAEAEKALAAARQREEDAEVTLKAADEKAAEAAARMKRATNRTEKARERKRIRLEGRQERQAAKDAQRAKAREERAAAREGKPTAADRVKRFVKVNAERLMVIGPITAPMAVAWTGQAGFAEDILGWIAPFTILFAAAWELSTAFVGWMYHQARQSGDAGTLYRVSTWFFAGVAAVMNYWHASGEPIADSRIWDPETQAFVYEMSYWNATPKAVAFAAMSITGMVLWELYASLIHRRKLRADGKVAKPRPSIGAVRWIRYPVHSWTAWSLAITDADLTTLDQAWTAAGVELADREAVRTGRARHRVVIPRVGADDHGPAAIPMVLTLTRTDRPGPVDGLVPVRPVRTGGHPVRSGPTEQEAVHDAVRTGGPADRSGGPALALESGPGDPHGADLRTTPGPDRTAPGVPASRTGPAAYGVTVRTADLMGGPGAADRPGPDGTEEGGPDRTVITLTDRERTALDKLRTEGLPLNRTNIAAEVRSKGGTISTTRAGQIAAALKQHA
ncbi:large Ala/Glu-rich protein [Streptomyces sp. NRRL F-2890]|uniref:large Ala/Glu-rich protein n=1 Tax=Streptomyces sp. NRRL F-2890 TaxID=1463845 RepID=UPI0005BADC41|nr:large Ala/Glu-rich protein [Streptomyces sp. NRRL F-2890]